MNYLFVTLAGALFGAGITISGMGNPAKVQNFLDLFGQWDPSLALVMGAALAVTTPGFRYVLKRGKPLFAADFSLPTLKTIDGKLIAGAVLFGMGWGLSGLCPAPALVALWTGASSFFLFVAAMIAGMFAYRFLMEGKSA
ncbi:YeeE/YedE family protein [Spongiibacter sp. KMU-158]|uniref:YeeE/YedE family protein n=1 Tax=Spongiibacter pelagi TaxID=2760804 RepID=A0A927GW19_9GAMM|nr:DUF6691 family protein [Spongiibacter pelagi]MBD2858995.1 YeeE/YedE family protein [Spongiibacter pelagi]